MAKDRYSVLDFPFSVIFINSQAFVSLLDLLCFIHKSDCLKMESFKGCDYSKNDKDPFDIF